MAKYFGVYRGIILSNVDPATGGRVKVRVADVPTAETAWALCCNTSGGGQPQIGDQCIVAFEAGDENYPVCLGKIGG